MGKALPPSVASCWNPHQPRVHPVLHIAFEDAVFDQDVFLRRRAFVINRERPAPVIQCAVVNHGHTGRGDAFSDHPGKRAGALAVEIALKPVADGFVQQYAGPAGAEQHCHFARWCGNRTQVDERLGQCLVNRVVPLAFFEQAVVEIASAKAVSAGFAPAIFFDNDRYV